MSVPRDPEAQQAMRARRPKRRRTAPTCKSAFLYALVAYGARDAMAQSCISLSGSTQCSAFNASSISTDSTLTGLFPFLSSVTDTASFDSGIQSYVAGGFSQERYGTLIGCSAFDASNTTDYYARYTTSVLCNAIIQNSITPCGLTGNGIRPLCAESCSEYAQSEEEIAASSLCGTTGANAMSQIRADFTNCALPADSLSGTCIEGYQNEPDNCGFSTNLGSLCTYCSASSPNSTDSCCVFSDTETRCANVVLPVVATSSMQPLFTSSTSSPTSSATGSGLPVTNNGHHSGLTGGQIAGIVVGSVLGALLLLGLLIGACLLMRRRRQDSPATSVFNQPATMRQAPPMAYNDGAQERAGLAVLPGGRVARMAALEGTSSSSDRNGASLMAAGGYRKSTSEEEDDSPVSRAALGLAPPPKRSGSLSSNSQLSPHSGDETSPSSGNGGMYSSPEGTGQSEQLGFFKDYYSQDEIHQSDLVSTLWAYEPRAADEFQLERGDMIKVIGIWDDGWATGVRVRQRAEDWREDGKVQRDSGMSTVSSKTPDTAEEGEVKAFPLVCVCLPQHWRRTIEGDSTDGSGAGRFPGVP